MIFLPFSVPTKTCVPRTTGKCYSTMKRGTVAILVKLLCIQLFFCSFYMQGVLKTKEHKYSYIKASS